MIKLFITSYLIISCTYGYGKFFQSKILKINDKLNNEFSPIIFGYFFIQIITVFLNFFLPLGLIITSLISVIGICLFFYKNYNIKRLLILFTIISLISTILIFRTNLNNDFSLYHGPFLSIISDNKIIFGLNNLHFRFGHISAQQYYEVIFANYLFPEIGISVSIAALFSSFIVFSLYTISKSSNYLNKTFLYLVILYFLLRAYRFSEFGNDLIPNLICIYIIYIYIYLFDNKKKLNETDVQNIILTIIIFCSIIIFSKLTLIVFILLPIILIIKQKIIFRIFKDLRIVIPIIFVALFLSKNLINTGCFFYPVTDNICIDTKWSSKKINTHSNSNIRSLQSEAWSKAWPERNKIQYKEYSETYIKNFNWLDSWMKKHFYVVLKNISIFVIFISFLFVTHVVKGFQKNDLLKQNLKNIKFPVMITAIGILFWFLKAPIYRYGFAYIIGFFTLLFGVFLFQKKNLYKVKIFKVFLILAITFFTLKNIIRINNSENLNIVDLSYKSKKNINYNIKKLNNIEIRYTKDGTCYLGTPICTNFPETLKEITIKEIKGYKFILLKEKL